MHSLFRRRSLVAVLLCTAAPLFAQEPSPAPEPTPSAAAPFRLGGEIKVHARDSKALSVRDKFPFPPNFLPPGEDAVFLRTVDAGGSLELSTATLVGEGEISSKVWARIEVRFNDLHNRNPTSSDDRIKVRDAWVRFGPGIEPLAIEKGSSMYVTVGLAPRFTRQVQRRLESYGLWSTAVGRFEQPQIQAGGLVKGALYWRAMVGNGNPVFFRDPNALAGDNGTPERRPDNVRPILQSGFPILYDAQPADLSFSDRLEWGGGLGLKAGDENGAIDVLGWYFTRRMERNVRLRGTSYGGDRQLLITAVGVSLPISGDKKREYGLNLEGRFRGVRFYGQYVDQEIAGLPRKGFEAEMAWRFNTDGLFLLGESPAFEWIQPVVRFSKVDNEWITPEEYPGPSVGWDWRKLDVGVRLAIVRNVDLTLEYARHNMKVEGRNLHPDEALVTLRAGF